MAGYVMPDTTFVLQRMGGEAVKARATIRFLPGGEVVGKAACNSYGAAAKTRRLLMLSHRCIQNISLD